MRIRPAVLSDAAAIAAVHVASWQVGYRGQLPDDHLDGLTAAQWVPRWTTSLTDTAWPGTGAIVAEEESGRLLGFADLRPSDDTGDDPNTIGMINSLYLLPGSWRAGVGRQLMTASLDTLAAAGYATATLWVLDTNARAIAFYAATGWHADGAVKDALFAGVMIRDLRYRFDLTGRVPDPAGWWAQRASGATGSAPSSIDG